MVKWCCMSAEQEPAHIYGHMLSPPSRSVLAFVNLVNIPNEFHVVDLTANAHLSDDYAKINPFQKVPAVVVGSFNVWESASIITFLADTYKVNSPWYPIDTKIRARINSYLHWHHLNTYSSITFYIAAKFFNPKFRGAPELTYEEEVPLKKKFDEFFDDFVWLLRETGYAARTQQPTIADVFAYSEISSLLFIGFDLGKYPTVKVWFDKIGAHKPIAQVHETLRNVAKSFGGKAN